MLERTVGAVTTETQPIIIAHLQWNVLVAASRPMLAKPSLVPGALTNL